jgi:hypothetical protein
LVKNLQLTPSQMTAAHALHSSVLHAKQKARIANKLLLRTVPIQYFDNFAYSLFAHLMVNQSISFFCEYSGKPP